MARRKKIGELRDTEVECGYCGAIISEDAVRCKSCGKVFSAAKKVIAFALVVIIVIAGMSYFAYTAYFTGQQAATNDLDPLNPDDTTPTPVVPGSKTIVFELKEADAPNTCANFKKYVNDQFFDGLIFHRIIDSFMIQGGGFYPDMTQKSATYPPINLEISSLRHTDGAVAMARTSDPNSATSQFYICDGPQSNLDDQYAVFGQVTSGLDVVRQISAVQTDTANGDVPLSPVLIQSARLSTSGGKTYVTLTVTF